MLFTHCVDCVASSHKGMHIGLIRDSKLPIHVDVNVGVCVVVWL